MKKVFTSIALAAAVVGELTSPKLAMAANDVGNAAIPPEVVRLYAQVARERVAIAKEAASGRTRTVFIMGLGCAVIGTVLGAQPGLSMKSGAANRVLFTALGGGVGLLAGGLGAPFAFAELNREPSPLDGTTNLAYFWNQQPLDRLLGMPDEALFRTVRQRYPKFDAEVLRYANSGEYAKRMELKAAAERERRQAEERDRLNPTGAATWAALRTLAGVGAAVVIAGAREHYAQQGAKQAYVQAERRGFSSVRPGMSRRQVYSILGNPDQVNNLPGSETWVYTDAEGRTHAVMFKAGVVLMSN